MAAHSQKEEEGLVWSHPLGTWLQIGGGLDAQADLLRTESSELNGVWVGSGDDDDNDDPSVDPIGIRIPIPF